MNPTAFEILLNNSPFVLGEGAVIERLRRNKDLELDPYLVNSAFIYDKAKRALLGTICRQYLDIGRELNVLDLGDGPGIMRNSWEGRKVSEGHPNRITANILQSQVRHDFRGVLFFGPG